MPKKLTLSASDGFFAALALLPFASVIWPVGIFQESDLAFLGLWVVAGVCAIIKTGPIQVGVLPIGFFCLALLSLIGVAQNGLTALGGINEIRECTATFLSLAIIIACVQPKQFYPFWLAPITYGVLTVFGFYGWTHLGWKTYVFLDISAFSMLASLPMYTAFRKSVTDTVQRNLWDTAYIAAFSYLLFYGDNMAAVVACACSAIFVFLLPIAKQYLKFLPKNDGFYVVAGLSFIAVMVLASWKFFAYLPLQLQSRTLLGIVTVLQYFDNFSFAKFMHLLFGYGWGSYQEFPVLNLFNLEHFSMYGSGSGSGSGSYKPNWEFLERNLLHSHNLILETLVSSGLVGVGVLLTFIYKWVQNIDVKDRSGRFFVVSYLILLSAWFQTPPVLVFCLLAMIFIKEKTTYTFTLPRLVWLVIGGFLITFASVEFWASYSLDKHKFNRAQTFEADTIAFIKDPAHVYDKISTYKSSNMIVARFIEVMRGLPTLTPETENCVISLTEDYLGSYQKRNVVSSVHVINLCNTFVHLADGKIDTNSKIFKLFKATLLEHLAKFPERADMTIGFLNWCFDKLQNISELEFMADEVLKVAPNHPVGLWFKGLAQLSLGVDKPQGLAKMKKAVTSGLLRFMPVDAEILQGLGIQQ